MYRNEKERVNSDFGRHGHISEKFSEYTDTHTHYIWTVLPDLHNVIPNWKIFFKSEEFERFREGFARYKHKLRIIGYLTK